MAISNLSETPGFSPVETVTPVISAPASSSGAATGEGISPTVQTIVPGEVLPVNATQQAPAALNQQSNDLGSVLSNALASADPDAEGATEGGEGTAGPEVQVPPLDLPATSVELPTAPVAPGETPKTPETYQSVLSPIVAPPKDNSVVVPARLSAVMETPRGSYTSVLPTMARSTKTETYEPARAVQASLNETSPLEIAKAYVGQDERNTESAEALSAFFKQAGGIDLDPSTTAWCAAFANAVLGKSGLGGTGKVNAQSFLSYGTPVDKPEVGDIVVFQRGPKGSWQGHVGFVAGVNNDGTLQVLGGNQGTDESGSRGVSVNVRKFGTESVLGYRRPVQGERLNG